MVRAVIDTNILLSIFLSPHPNSVPRQIWRAFLAKRFSLVTSPTILNEFKEVLGRPKISPLLRDASHKDATSFLKVLSEVVDSPVIFSSPVCRDPEDEHILATAIHSRADFIVSGDKDLLTLKSFQNIPIMTPAQFLRELKKS